MAFLLYDYRSLTHEGVVYPLLGVFVGSIASVNVPYPTSAAAPRRLHHDVLVLPEQLFDGTLVSTYMGSAYGAFDVPKMLEQLNGKGSVGQLANGVELLF